MEEEVSSFKLQSSTDSFISRSRDVFASLAVLEDKHSAYLKATAASRNGDESGLLKNDPDEGDEFINRAEMKNMDSEDFRSWSHGRSLFSKSVNSDYESRSRSRSPKRDHSSSTEDVDKPNEDCNFKRPAQPAQRSVTKSIPDFRKHPERYTKYSLEDVSDHDMSERSNQRAAFDFLEEQRFEKEKLESKLAGLPEEELKFDISNAACSQGKIAFSSPRQKKVQSNACEKSANKNDMKMLFSEPNSDLPDSDEDSKLPEPKNKSTDVKNLSANKTSSNIFRSRKNVKRHIRTKESEADSD